MEMEIKMSLREKKKTRKIPVINPGPIQLRIRGFGWPYKPGGGGGGLISGGAYKRV